MPQIDRCGHGHPPCGAVPARRYMHGNRCLAHAPHTLAGLPAPDTARYCLRVCYCGSCPQFVPLPPPSTEPAKPKRRRAR